MSEVRTRIALVAGIPGSGKTTVIREATNGHDIHFIANNDESAEMMRDAGCDSIDVFPFRSPCARVRQFQARVMNAVNEDHPSIIISEPPGNCLEMSSPMMNQLYLLKDEGIELAPLITVIKAPDLLEKGTSDKSTESFRYRNMINESDVIVLTFSNEIDQRTRDELMESIQSINEGASVIFFSEGEEGADELSKVIFGDDGYRRPLVY